MNRSATSVAIVVAATLGCRTRSADGIGAIARLVAEVPCVPEVPGAVYHCGRLIVPEARDSVGQARGSRTVTLEFAVFEANRQPRQPDPILYLTDGPGISAFAGLLRVRQYQAEGTDRDLIVLEERGNGYSTPAFLCPVDDDSAFTRLRGCRDSLVAAGVDLDQYRTAAAAIDYADLARLLGIDRANLYAIGYGARLAFQLAGRYPPLVRSLVLDGPIDRPAASSATSQLDALGLLARQCEADPTCHRRYPDVRASFAGLLERLERAPGANGSPTPSVFFDMVVGALGDQAKLAGIPAGIDTAVRGDWIAAARLLQRGADLPEGIAMARMNLIGTRLAMGCAPAADLGELTPADRWPAAVIGVARQRDRIERDRCRVWQEGRSFDDAASTPAGNQPTLLLVGENDPSGAVSVGDRLVAQLPAATAVRLPATSRDGLAHRCPRDLMRAFLAAPERPLDRGCVAQMQKIQFVTP